MPPNGAKLGTARRAAFSWAEAKKKPTKNKTICNEIGNKKQPGGVFSVSFRVNTAGFGYH